jgi:hypothetical protein
MCSLSTLYLFHPIIPKILQIYPNCPQNAANLHGPRTRIVTNGIRARFLCVSSFTLSLISTCSKQENRSIPIFFSSREQLNHIHHFH